MWSLAFRLGVIYQLWCWQLQCMSSLHLCKATFLPRSTGGASVDCNVTDLPMLHILGLFMRKTRLSCLRLLVAVIDSVLWGRHEEMWAVGQRHVGHLICSVVGASGQGEYLQQGQLAMRSHAFPLPLSIMWRRRDSSLVSQMRWHSWFSERITRITSATLSVVPLSPDPSHIPGRLLSSCCRT